MQNHKQLDNNEFLQHINSIPPNIFFTVKIEKD